MSRPRSSSRKTFTQPRGPPSAVAVPALPEPSPFAAPALAGPNDATAPPSGLDLEAMAEMAKASAALEGWTFADPDEKTPVIPTAVYGRPPSLGERGAAPVTPAGTPAAPAAVIATRAPKLELVTDGLDEATAPVVTVVAPSAARERPVADAEHKRRQSDHPMSVERPSPVLSRVREELKRVCDLYFADAADIQHARGQFEAIASDPRFVYFNQAEVKQLVAVRSKPIIECLWKGYRKREALLHAVFSGQFAKHAAHERYRTLQKNLEDVLKQLSSQCGQEASGAVSGASS